MADVVSLVNPADVHKRICSVGTNGEKFLGMETLSFICLVDSIKKVVFGYNGNTPNTFIKMFLVVDATETAFDSGSRNAEGIIGKSVIEETSHITSSIVELTFAMVGFLLRLFFALISTRVDGAWICVLFKVFDIAAGDLFKGGAFCTNKLLIGDTPFFAEIAEDSDGL
jgi:hypothetical protein